MPIFQFSSVQLPSRVRFFVIPWTTTHWASLFITNSQSLPKLMSIDLVIPSKHLILYHSLLLWPSIFPSIRVFPMTQFFASGGQSIGVSASASVLPMNTQGWSPLGWTGWISLQSKGLSKTWGFMCVFSSGFVVQWKLEEFHPSVVCVLVWRNILEFLAPLN